MGMGMGAVVLMELTEDFFRFFLPAEEAEADDDDDGVILVLLFVLTPLVAVVVTI